MPLGGLGDGCVEIAVVAYDLARFARRLLERSLVRRRVVAAVRAVVPGDLERAATLDGRIGVAREDGDAADRIEHGRRRAALDLQDALDARHLERFRGIEARHLAAVDWGTRHDGVEHPIEPGVDAVLRLAGGDVPAVNQLQLTLADVAEL